MGAEGLRIREERTGELLYHHPVARVSFIAQDVTDGRAFGYVYGGKERRFFGVKTERASSLVSDTWAHAVHVCVRVLVILVSSEDQFENRVNMVKSNAEV